MGNVILYGDSVTILNGYSNWKGGYLDSYGVDSRPGAKYGVLTSVSPTRGGATGIWRVESASGKTVGSEVLDNDSILLQNLYKCDGGYLGTYGTVSYPTELYGVNTADKKDRPIAVLTWTIRTQGSDGKVREGDVVHFYNQYQNDGGFLDTCNNSTYPETLYEVFTSKNPGRENLTGIWKLTKVEDPCKGPENPEVPGGCGGSCGDTSGDKQCFSLPPNTDFGLTALVNSAAEQTIKLFIDDQLKDTIVGKGVNDVNLGTKIYNSGKGKVCVSVEANGKPCKLKFVDKPLNSQPGIAIVGAEDGTDNDYNDSIVMLNWPLK